MEVPRLKSIVCFLELKLNEFFFVRNSLFFNETTANYCIFHLKAKYEVRASTGENITNYMKKKTQPKNTQSSHSVRASWKFISTLLFFF